MDSDNLECSEVFTSTLSPSDIIELNSFTLPPAELDVTACSNCHIPVDNHINGKCLICALNLIYCLCCRSLIEIKHSINNHCKWCTFIDNAKSKPIPTFQALQSHYNAFGKYNLSSDCVFETNDKNELYCIDSEHKHSPPVLKCKICARPGSFIPLLKSQTTSICNQCLSNKFDEDEEMKIQEKQEEIREKRKLEKAMKFSGKELTKSIKKLRKNRLKLNLIKPYNKHKKIVPPVPYVQNNEETYWNNIQANCQHIICYQSPKRNNWKCKKCWLYFNDLPATCLESRVITSRC